jgi:3-hydroxy-9,10-secoandrosta-1,3,5(10)-triene-9,17-dione monooxygenase reductase component
MWEEVLAPVRPEFDHKDFRGALGCFPTGVCLITTLGPGGERVGLTVNSFSSVSLEPPMVLWGLARSANCAPVFRDAEYFVINVLAAPDATLSTHFAKPGADKFQKYQERFAAGLGGAPLLHGAVANFECHSRYRKYGGDHIILIGVVERYRHSELPPLLFHRGRYAGVGS